MTGERVDVEAGGPTSVPADKADADALLASWRCCGAPSLCGARCMDDEESHRLAQFVAYIDNERANFSGYPAALAVAEQRGDDAEVERARVGEWINNYKREQERIISTHMARAEAAEAKIAKHVHDGNCSVNCNPTARDQMLRRVLEAYRESVHEFCWSSIRADSHGGIHVCVLPDGHDGSCIFTDPVAALSDPDTQGGQQ